MKKQKRKTSVLTVWMMSYSSLLLVILGIFPFIFFWTRDLVELEVQRSHTLTLQQIQIDHDRLFNDLEFQSILQGQNERVISLTNAGNSLTPEQLFDAHKISQDFRNITASNSSLNGIMLVLHESQLVISNETVGMSDILIPRFLKEYEIEETYFQDLIALNHQRTYWSTNFQNSIQKNQYLLFLRSLPLLDQTTTLSSLIFIINTETLDRISFQIYQETGGWVSIINRDQQIIFSSRPFDHLDTLHVLQTLPVNQTIQQIDLIDQEYILLSTASRNLGWTYFLFTPQTQFWDRIQQISQIMIFATITGLTIGIVLIVIFLRKQYSPLHEILTFVESQTNKFTGNDSNEYDQIKQKIQLILSEKAETETQLLQRNTILQGYFLEKALRGQSSFLSIEDASNAFDVDWISDHFVLVSIFLEQNDDSNQTDNNHSEELTVNLSLQWFIEKELQTNYLGIMAHISDVSVLLINLKQDSKEKNKKYISELNTKLRAFIENQYETQMSIGVSSIIGFKDISVGYKESLDSLEYAMATQSKEVIFFDHLVNSSDAHYFYTTQDEDHWLSTLKRGQTQESINLLTDILEKNAKIPLSHSSRKCFWYDLSATLLKAMIDLSIDDKKSLKHEWEIIQDLIDNEQTQAFHTSVHSFVELLTEKLSNNQNAKNKTVSPLVEEHIKNFYHSFELNLSSIAEALNLHPTYLSQRFRIETGYGILDYINDYRLEKAKELNKTNNTLSLDQISTMVGYSSTKTFTRICKKKFGMIPSKVFSKE